VRIRETRVSDRVGTSPPHQIKWKSYQHLAQPHRRVFIAVKTKDGYVLDPGLEEVEVNKHIDLEEISLRNLSRGSFRKNCASIATKPFTGSNTCQYSDASFDMNVSQKRPIRRIRASEPIDPDTKTVSFRVGVTVRYNRTSQGCQEVGVHLPVAVHFGNNLTQRQNLEFHAGRDGLLPGAKRRGSEGSQASTWSFGNR
jgi:hypothetical protein